MFTYKHYTRHVKRLTPQSYGQEPGVCDLKKNNTIIVLMHDNVWFTINKLFEFEL